MPLGLKKSSRRIGRSRSKTKHSMKDAPTEQVEGEEHCAERKTGAEVRVRTSVTTVEDGIYSASISTTS